MHSNSSRFSVVEPTPELLAAVVRSSGDAIVTVNPDGVITSWNAGAEALTGYLADEAVGYQVSLIVPPSLLDEANNTISNVLAGKHYSHFESRIIKKDNSGMRVSVSLSPVKSGNDVIGVSFIIRDANVLCKAREPEIEELNEILEQKVAERTAELREANQALEAFSYSVSHDLKAPVRAINNFVKIISKDCSQQLTPDIAELLEHIESNSLRMNSIIEDLLTLARHNRTNLDYKEVDMTMLVNKVWGFMAHSMPNSASLQVEPLPVVEADASMIEQVVVNLLSNAVKYSSRTPQAKVNVGCRTEDGNYVFYIKDNGAGFDMQYYDRLFGVFERLHSASEFDGTGVGLYLVKRIVEKHGGSVWAWSQPGEGAEFYFTLPINKYK
ncbi:MAG TPA: ATP-binding protein [Chitinophagales bacterium]|nr:ATP-binding protein [Chitinophagales bacterium]